MQELFDRKFISAIKSLNVEDAPLARRMIKGRLDKYMPESMHHVWAIRIWDMMWSVRHQMVKQDTLRSSYYLQILAHSRLQVMSMQRRTN